MCVNQMVLWVVIHCFKSSSVGAFRLHLVVTKVVPISGDVEKKKELCCSMFEWGTK